MDIFWSFVKAFVVGGLICVVGQALLQTTKLTNARILVLFVTAGVFLTAWVFLVYNIALRYENPFTSEIYAKRDREQAAAKKRSKKAQ